MGRLNPLPYREIKRRLEAAGFIEVSQKGSHAKFARFVGERVDIGIVPKSRRCLSALSEVFSIKPTLTLPIGMSCRLRTWAYRFSRT